jgi:hypothetical protein
LGRKKEKIHRKNFLLFGPLVFPLSPLEKKGMGERDDSGAHTATLRPAASGTVRHLGVTLSNNDGGGALINDADPSDLIAEVGLKAGCVITAINGTTVAGHEDALRALEAVVRDRQCAAITYFDNQEQARRAVAEEAAGGVGGRRGPLVPSFGKLLVAAFAIRCLALWWSLGTPGAADFLREDGIKKTGLAAFESLVSKSMPGGGGGGGLSWKETQEEKFKVLMKMKELREQYPLQLGQILDPLGDGEIYGSMDPVQAREKLASIERTAERRAGMAANFRVQSDGMGRRDREPASRSTSWESTKDEV